MLRKWQKELSHLINMAEAVGVDAPRCVKLINELREAFNDEIGIVSNRRGRWSRYRGGRRRTIVRGLSLIKQMTIYRQRWNKLRRRNEKLRETLAKQMDSKTLGGRVAEEWICRVIACAPHVSSRALEDTLHLATNSDTTTVSRFSVRGIRAAWLEMYREIVFSRCRENIAKARTATQRGGEETQAAASVALTFTEPQAALLTPATGGVLVVPERLPQIKFRNAASIRPPFVGAVLLHVQDEADMRLLSTDAYDGGPIPKRGRASKIQLNVLDLLIRGVHVGIPTELVALADKSARTLATCFENLLRDVLGNILDKTPATGGGTAPATGGVTTPATGDAVPIYLVHVMLGDAIATNALAARLLWAIQEQQPLAQNVVYFLLAVRCGNHQAALSAKYAVSGVGAKTASGDSTTYAAVAGTATRLFNYVIGDYFHDFAKSAREWGRSNVAAWPSAFGSQPQAEALRNLYGPRVVPDAVMDHLRDVAVMDHLDEDRRADTTERWQSFLVKLLRTDDHPTESRFFTFRECIDNMLLMTLLEFEDTLTLKKGTP